MLRARARSNKLALALSFLQPEDRELTQMPQITLENGLTVRVRAFRRSNEHVVLADAVRGAQTQAYDREYRDSIQQFEKDWLSGRRDQELPLPSTGAEVFMADLYCEAVGVRPRDVARVDTRLVGGSGTEWRVRWNIDGRFYPRFRVGDTVERSATVMSVKL